MKKLFLISMAATAMLAGCSNDETLDVVQPKAIGFSNAFVNNSTRSIDDPSFVNTGTTNLLKDFVVYGYTQNGKIFDGVEVSRANADAEWTYTPLQYWVPGNTYTFGAIAPKSVKSNISGVSLPTNGTKVEMKVSFTNKNDNQIDLLHAAPTQIAGTSVDKDYKVPVSLNFYHQLSKVKFSFTNAVGEGYSVKVTGVKIKNAYSSGTLTVGATGNSWSAQSSNNLELTFGNVVAEDATTDVAAEIANGATLESYAEKLMIPMNNTATYTVEFTTALYKGNVLLAENQTRTATISDVEFKLGNSYDFKATLTHENITEDPLNPIQFTVSSIENWTPQSEPEQDITLDSASE